MQLLADVVIVIDGRAADLQRLRAGNGDHVADPAAVLVLPRATLLVVVIIGDARCPHMRRHVALVVVEGAAQAFAVDQAIIEFTGQGFAHVIAHVVLIRLAVEDH
ncbi:hypothetical protein D3C87_1778250 [compost metagenome]